MEISLQTAREAAPGFRPDRIIARSVKTNIVRGDLDGRQVVAKVLSNDQPHWRWYLAREIAIYRAFERLPPPVPVPVLVAADARRGVLVLERHRGRLLGRGRLAAARVDRAMVAVLIADLLRLSRWRGAPAESDLEIRGPVPGLGDRGSRARPLPDPQAPVPWLDLCVERWGERGLIDRALRAVLIRRLRRPLAQVFAHGDMLLRNVIEGAAAPVYFDWEFAGHYPFGWDLGLLWVGLEGPARAALDTAVDALPAAKRDMVRLCAVLGAARELEVRRVSLRQGRDHHLVARLERDLARARERLGDAG